MTVAAITVLFEEPFWVVVYERQSDGVYEVCKVTFGSEPKDCEVYEFLLKNWNRLKFSPPIKSAHRSEKCVNPKREQREIKKQLAKTGIGTKAQQAIRLQYEAGKQERKMRSKAQREADGERKFRLRQEKRREKHRGH